MITPRVFCSDVDQHKGYVRVCGRIVDMDPGREHYVIDDGMYVSCEHLVNVLCDYVNLLGC